jgi:hypothetical protein
MTHPMKAIGARVIVPERDEHKPVSQRV